MTIGTPIDRRFMLIGGAAAGAAGLLSRVCAAQVGSGLVVSVTEFGARPGTVFDSTAAIQSAIDEVHRRGGGTVLVPGRFLAGNLRIPGDGVRLQGQSGWLVNARVTVPEGVQGFQMVDLSIIDRRGDRRTYLLDIAGRNCQFANVQLVKEPAAAGYQMYMRQPSAGCSFSRLRLRGSNGVMVAGTGHRFEDFDFASGADQGIGGDDAFAIKGLQDETRDIVIRNGRLRGYAALVSIGSEVGTKGDSGHPGGAVRNVLVENVSGEVCGGVAFIKPGALIHDWRNGVVEQIRLKDLSLQDPTGEQFRCGIRIIAARGAVVRNVNASNITIVARAKDRGIAPTAAIDISTLTPGEPATIEDIDLRVRYFDPLSGSSHSSAAPGYPVDYIARVARARGSGGVMARISLDVDGRGAAFGGIMVGKGLDDVVTVRRAVLSRVATDPPSTLGGGGIWSDSRIILGDVSIESVKLPKFAGSAFEAAPRKP